MRIPTKKSYGFDSRGRRVAIALPVGQPQKGFDLEAEQAGKQTQDYSQLKQPQLKQLCTERGIAFKKGPIKNADLIALLEQSDKAAR